MQVEELIKGIIKAREEFIYKFKTEPSFIFIKDIEKVVELKFWILNMASHQIYANEAYLPTKFLGMNIINNIDKEFFLKNFPQHNEKFLDTITFALFCPYSEQKYMLYSTKENYDLLF